MRERAFVVPLLTFALLVLAELTGLVPPSVVFRGGNIVLVPRAVDFPPTLTLAYLVVVNLGLILAPALNVLPVIHRMFRFEPDTLDAAALMRELIPPTARALTRIAKTDGPPA